MLADENAVHDPKCFIIEGPGKHVPNCKCKPNPNEKNWIGPICWHCKGKHLGIVCPKIEE